MFRTGSSSSLSDTTHSPVESSHCCLLISFSFLILALPCLVLLIIILNRSIFRLRGSCPAVKVHVIDGSSGVILGCSLLGRGFFLAIPLSIVIVRVISSCFVICQRHYLKNTCEVELDRNVVVEKKRDACISILSLIYAAMFVLCQLIPHAIAQLIAA